MAFEREFMDIALALSKKAFLRGEVPIGAVVVRGGKVIAKAHNRREKTQNALKHAEMIAIARACRRLKSWRLDGCDMYVTLEPCQMCMGAIVNARIKTVFVGARTTSDLNWKSTLEYTDNAECAEILKKFFAEKR